MLRKKGFIWVPVRSILEALTNMAIVDRCNVVIKCSRLENGLPIEVRLYGRFVKSLLGQIQLLSEILKMEIYPPSFHSENQQNLRACQYMNLGCLELGEHNCNYDINKMQSQIRELLNKISYLEEENKMRTGGTLTWHRGEDVTNSVNGGNYQPILHQSESILFATPFRRIPQVLVSIVGMVTENGTVNLSAKAQDVTCYGFTLTVEGSPNVRNLQLEWVAL